MINVRITVSMGAVGRLLKAGKTYSVTESDASEFVRLGRAELVDTTEAVIEIVPETTPEPALETPPAPQPKPKRTRKAKSKGE